MRSFILYGIAFFCTWSSMRIQAQTCAPMVHYELDGNALDATANGMDGIVFGASPTIDRTGAVGRAMYFDGINDRIDLPDDFDLPERTWALWFKADLIDGSVHMIYDLDHANYQNAQTELFFREENGVKNLIMDMGSTNTIYRQEVEEGRWYHVAQVRSATGVTFYIDGCPVFTSTDLANAHSTSGFLYAALGTGRYHNEYYFQGSLDDVRMYGCALTGPEIGGLAEHACPVPVPDSSWLFVPDVISPNNDGSNDVFRVPSNGLARISVDIFNRWGQSVGGIKQVGMGWDGRTPAGGAVPEGIYFYILDADGYDGRHYDMHGAFTLLR